MPDSRRAVSRARFFLEKAKRCSVDETEDFEAYLEAAIIFARSSVHRMRLNHENDHRMQDWWESLRGNPDIEFFRTERDWILKHAAPKIGQKVFPASVGSKDASDSPTCATEMYYFGDPRIPATDTVETHLAAIEQHLKNAEALLNSEQDSTLSEKSPRSSSASARPPLQHT